MTSASWRATRFAPPQPGARHAVAWYDQRGEDVVLGEGDRIFVPCHGGPSVSRAETFPPRLEIAEPDGTYVLVDVGPRADWHYEFVPHA